MNHLVSLSLHSHKYVIIYTFSRRTEQKYFRLFAYIPQRLVCYYELLVFILSLRPQGHQDINYY